jgi:hypothetical protein
MLGAARHRPRPTLGATCLIALGAVCVLAPGAGAVRPATPGENAAIAAALQVPDGCIQSDISTVDATWAAAYVLADEDCPAGDGAIILHLTDAWRPVYEGPADETPCPLDPAVPDDVARDLELCFKPSTKVYLAYYDGKLKYKPSKLIAGAHGEIQKLSWKSWGKLKATGKGTLDYADAYTHFKAPLKLTLSDRGYCGHKRAYLRITTAAARASDRRKLRFITGVTELSCPDQ